MIGAGHLTSEKCRRFGDHQAPDSYLERETGLEPATLCLEGRWSIFLARRVREGVVPPSLR
jgi:hypothetical protein